MSPDLTHLSCFSPITSLSGATRSTSIYETPLGLAALTWSRTALGLSLHVDLRPLSFPYSTHFHLRPWLLWKRHGTKQFLPDNVDFAWDLRRATFGTGPEPAGDFYVAASVNGNMFFLVGESKKMDVHKKVKAKEAMPVDGQVLLSKREYVDVVGSGDVKSFSTKERIAGEVRRMSVELGGGSDDNNNNNNNNSNTFGLRVRFDGKTAVHIKRLKWKFRGNETVEFPGGARVQVSWDVHNWLFSGESSGQAVIVFREKGQFGRRSRSMGEWGCFGNGNCDGFGEVVDRRSGGHRRRRSGVLKPSSSSSSTSSVSSVGGSSVMDWESLEENEMKDSDGFSLLVYFRR